MTAGAVVVGAGAAGMTAALLLASHGREVTLVERASSTAPLLGGFERGGVRFDTAFHYAGGLEPGGMLRRLLERLGLDRHLRIRPLDDTGFDVVRCREGLDEFRFRGGPALREDLLARFPAEAAAIETFLDKLVAARARFPYLNPEGDEGPADPHPGAGSSTLAEVLDGLILDPALRHLLSVHSFLHGSEPEEIPFDLHAVVAGYYLESASTIDGGGAAIARAFERQLVEAGVTVLTGRAATGVLAGADGVTGIELDGGQVLSCRSCVLTVHPALLPGLLPPGVFRPAKARRLADWPETPGVVALSVIADEPPAILQGRNLFLTAGTAPPLFRTGRPVGERPLFLSAAPADGRHLSRGFTVLCPVDTAEVAPWKESRSGRRPPGYLEWKKSIAGQIVGRLSRECPELGSFTLADVATPLTLRDWTGAPHGGMYGPRHRTDLPPLSTVTRLPGLHLAGQGTTSPGMMGAMISGWLAVGAILGHALLRGELAQCA